VGEWRVQVSVRVSQATRTELEKFAAAKKRTLAIRRWSFGIGFRAMEGISLCPNESVLSQSAAKCPFSEKILKPTTTHTGWFGVV